MFTCAKFFHAITFSLSVMAEHIETPPFQQHVPSDLGPLESFVNSETFPEQIAIIEIFSKFRKFPDCACLQGANSPRDIIEYIKIPFSNLP